jgi:hypothetical protein
VRVHTAADLLPPLAIELGRFMQVSAALEHAVQSAIIRLLPITDTMGFVLFAQNSAKTNREILEGLLSLPEVQIDEAWRTRLCGFLPKVKQFQEDRNRLVHNRIVCGEDDLLVVLRVARGGAATALPVTVAEIKSWSDEAAEMAAMISSVPHAEYDLSRFEKGWPQFDLKRWPGRNTN